MESNQLPAEVQERIKADADAATDKEEIRLKSLNQEYGRMVSQLHGYELGYIAGATAEAMRSQPGAVWVKASERLPGWKQPVRWRHSGGTPQNNAYPLFVMITDGGSAEEFDEWEWLDESPAEQPVVSQDAHEKEVMMQAFDKVRKIFELRKWIMEGRGSYPYNDDRYKEEVRYMYDEFDQLFNDTWNNIKSKSIEYREWIIDEYLQKDHPAIHDILTRLGYRKAAEQPGREVERSAVFVPCTEDDPDCCGGYTSNDGRSLCYVKEVLVPLSSFKQPTAAKLEPGLIFHSTITPINSYEVIEVFDKTNEFKVKVTRECEVNKTTCFEVWRIDGFKKYYELGVYYIKKEVKP